LCSFQDYSHLTAFATVTYKPDYQSATVTVTALHKANATLSYSFDGKDQASNTITFDATTTKPVTLTVKGDDKTQIELEPLDFKWNAAPLNLKYPKADYRDGQKGAIVEMFGWPHADVEKECAFLAEAGYMGVKVFPPQESVMSTEPFNGVLNPWYFFYQPVSYKLSGRSGTRDELRSMINTCRSLGVRVYADAVVNHMTGGGNDANPDHRNPNAGCAPWGAKESTLPGGTSPMYTQSFTYTTNPETGMAPLQEFPAASYGPLDFHCERSLNSWTDPLDLNAGWLTGLTDLNTERENVQERIAAYLTDLLSIGFSGFRMDAAKHIKPDDLVGIFTKLQRNMGGEMPEDFITWLEILLGGEASMLMCDSDSGYNYGSYFEDALLDAGISKADVEKIKIWNSGYPKEPDNGACTISKSRNAIQNDDADQQNPGSTSRDMGNAGCVLIKDCGSDDEHRQFEKMLFENPPGLQDADADYPIRLVLSSFYFTDGIQGIPDGKSDCDLCTVECDSCTGFKKADAFVDASIGYDKSDYTRAHRDPEVVKSMQAWMKI
jgi:alpha-amylase